MDVDPSGAQLVERTGRHPGRAHPLPDGEHLLGRGRGVSIVLDGDDVSRRHARLQVDDEGVVVHDLGSKNGIYVDGGRVGEPTRIVHGGTIEIGDLKLELVHPASRIAGVLARAGEPTVTRTRRRAAASPDAPSLLLPLIGVAVFGGLVAALLLL